MAKGLKPRQSKRRKPIGKRDYAAEYARRIALAESRGLSRSVGRGHARAGERPRPSGVRLVNPYMPDERALKRMAQGDSLRAAAKAVGVTEERLRRHLKESTNARRIGRRWEISDQRPRQYPFGRLVRPSRRRARQLFRRSVPQRGRLLALLPFLHDLDRGKRPSALQESLRCPPLRRNGDDLQHDAIG